MSDEIQNSSLTALTTGIRNGRYTSTEIVDVYLDRIESYNDRFNAFITVFDERAREKAQQADREVETGEEIGPLHGIPVAIKDSRAVAGERHTWGTKLLSDNVADADDQLVTRLQNAGAILIGKTNLPEFALMGGTDNLLIGPTANPFNHDKMVGGSSGGSAAAVAAGLVPIAQGEDGGGSLRIPASTCGIYTIKPTFGRVGQFSPGRSDAFNHTPMQSAGPLARRVEDAALMLDVLVGPHPGDPFSLPTDDIIYRDVIHDSIEDYNIAFSPNLDLYPIDSRVENAIERAVQTFEDAGATVHKIAIDFGYSREEITDAFMCQSNVLTSKFGQELKTSHNIDILGENRDDILSYLVEQFETGRSTSALEYKTADTVRTDVFDTVQKIFTEYDLLVSSSLMVLPFKKSLLREQPGPSEINGTRLDEYRWGTLIDWRSTQITNMTGHPAASIPAGFVDGLPVGMELIGPRFGEASVLAASETFESHHPWQQEYQRLP